MRLSMRGGDEAAPRLALAAKSRGGTGPPRRRWPRRCPPAARPASSAAMAALSKRVVGAAQHQRVDPLGPEGREVAAHHPAHHLVGRDRSSPPRPAGRRAGRRGRSPWRPGRAAPDRLLVGAARHRALVPMTPMRPLRVVPDRHRRARLDHAQHRHAAARRAAPGAPPPRRCCRPPPGGRCRGGRAGAALRERVLGRPWRATWCRRGAGRCRPGRRCRPRGAP